MSFTAFYKCRSIESVQFPTTFNGYRDGRWFQYCTKLQKVRITKNVSKIPGYTFANCTKLTDIYCEATTPPKLDTGWNNLSFDEYYAFVACPINSITLHVPKGCMEKYATAIGWGKFSIIVDDENDAGIDCIEVDDTSDFDVNSHEVEVYNMQGFRIDLPASPGCYILRKGNRIKKVIIK